MLAAGLGLRVAGQHGQHLGPGQPGLRVEWSRFELRVQVGQGALEVVQALLEGGPQQAELGALPVKAATRAQTTTAVPLAETISIPFWAPRTS